MGLLATASVAIDGSKFKAVNNRDKNFTRAKVERRRAQLEESVARYLSQLDTADRQEPTEALAAKVTRLTEKRMHPASTPGCDLPLRIAQAATAALGFRFGFQFQGSRSTTLLAG
jgi:hypothetical protein